VCRPDVNIRFQDFEKRRTTLDAFYRECVPAEHASHVQLVSSQRDERVPISSLHEAIAPQPGEASLLATLEIDCLVARAFGKWTRMDPRIIKMAVEEPFVHRDNLYSQ